MFVKDKRQNLYLRARITSDFQVPPGGMALWARVAADVDVDRWAERALAAGVWFHPPRRFVFDGGSPQALRLGFAALDEDELAAGVKRLVTTLRLK